jgi:hypothetical protein
MKRIILLLIVLSTFIVGCSKERDVTLRYPKTELANTTWKRFNFKSAVSGREIYEFIKFTNSTSLDMYSAHLDGSDAFNKKTYTYKLNISDKNMDSFVVFYPNGDSGIGFTTGDINNIQYNNFEFSRVE